MKSLLHLALFLLTVQTLSAAENTEQKKFWDWIYQKAARTQTGRKVRRQAETLGLRKRCMSEVCVDIYDDIKETYNSVTSSIKNGVNALSSGVSNCFQWIKSKVTPIPPPPTPVTVSGKQ